MTDLTVLTFVTTCSLALLLLLLFFGRRSRLDKRLDSLAERHPDAAPQGRGVGEGAVKDFAKTALPKLGTPLVPKKEGERTQLTVRLLHAGLYRRQALLTFLGVKMLLMVTPILLGFAAASAGLVPLDHGLVFGVLCSIIGMIGPSFWLDRRKKTRQTNFRRALPDALDVLVICLEGGLSLPGALRRVSNELHMAHPLLAQELQIVEREIQLGLSAGEALQEFAKRSDLEEVRSLASVITQAERFGASLARALRIHAESLRIRRLQYAEEMAQKAAVKILFPTVLFIFPGLFVVLLAPAVIQIAAAFRTVTP